MPPSSDDLPGRRPPRSSGGRGAGGEEERGKQPGSPRCDAVGGPGPDRGPLSRAAVPAAWTCVPLTWVLPGRFSRRRSRSRRRSGCSTTCTARGAPAGRRTSRRGRRACRIRAVDRPQAAGPGRVPGGFPACAGGAVPAAVADVAARGVGGVHPLVPGQGRVAGRRGGGADPDPDHRRPGGGVRRDHAAVRAGRRRSTCTARHRTVLRLRLGARSLDAMADAGILPGFAGIVVSDRYQNYFHPRWEHIAGNQACLSHLLRDFGLRREHPGAVWPVQAQRALRGLIHAWHAAREQGLDAIPAGMRDAGARVPARRPGRWPACPASPDRRTARSRSPAASCWNRRDRRSDVLLFTETPACGPRYISEREPPPENPAEDLPAASTRHPDRLDIRSSSHRPQARLAP